MRLPVWTTFLLIIIFVGLIFWPPQIPSTPHITRDLWSIRSVDTMKYSRDLAREKLSDESFNNVIDQQIGNIAGTGATHVAIATPYDAEFLPFLSRWISSARAHGLHIWFRGNLSGWEGWFGYKKISRVEHATKVVEFIKANANLFENGDIFTACPECENGGPGDPRSTGDVEGHRQFLIDEYKAVNAAFRAINKNVTVGYSSMNYDVAKLIMDKDTTTELGGIVAIDHYVKDAGKLAEDINSLADSSGGKIFLGEFGAPIPDIHKDMTEQGQAIWLEQNLATIEGLRVVTGLSYWTSVGGSTELWHSDGTPKEAVQVLSKYFHKKI